MTVLIYVLQALLIAAFLPAGLLKIWGSKMHKDEFVRLQLPQWFRVVTGLIEFAASVLLIIGFWQEVFTLWGALILMATGIGGVFVHIRVKDSVKITIPIAALGTLALILSFLVM